MDNLKITFKLNNSAQLNRLTTIDSILLSAFYRGMSNSGKRVNEIDEDHKKVDWIHRENGVMSGSIWYVERDAIVDYDFHTIVRNPEKMKIEKATNQKTYTPNYKPALVNEELLITQKIHFYIRADKKIVNLLLSIVKNIGSLERLNYGEVKDYVIEVIEDDKGFMLNKTTASKPLPLDSFSVESKKIAFYRRTPPYWLKHGKVACYMPTSSLYEVNDNTNSNEYKVSKKLDYISNIDFLYNKGNDKKIKKFDNNTKKNIEFNNKDLIDSTKVSLVKNPLEKVTDNITQECVFSGQIAKSGWKGSVYNHLTKGSRSGFSDTKFIGKGNFLSKQAFWCLNNLHVLGYTYVTNDKWVYLQSKKAISAKELSNLLNNLKSLNPPFSINLKDTANAQHISFKNQVSISSAYFYLQYGETTLFIDAELLSNAIHEIKSITKKYANISKTHLCRDFRGVIEVTIKHSEKEKELLKKIIMEFQKKYDKDIRLLLSVSSID
jgi:hypothetical protein